jgi:hypothetical protein
MTETIALKHLPSPVPPIGNQTIYFHTEEGVEDDDVSLDWDLPHLLQHAFTNLLTSDPTFSPRRQQFEAV